MDSRVWKSLPLAVNRFQLILRSIIGAFLDPILDFQNLDHNTRFEDSPTLSQKSRGESERLTRSEPETLRNSQNIFSMVQISVPTRQIRTAPYTSWCALWVRILAGGVGIPTQKLNQKYVVETHKRRSRATCWVFLFWHQLLKLGDILEK